MKKLIIVLVMLIMALPAMAMSPDECREKYKDYIQLQKIEEFKGQANLVTTSFHAAVLKRTVEEGGWSDRLIIERKIDKNPAAVILSLESPLIKISIAVIEYKNHIANIVWRVKDIPEQHRRDVNNAIDKFGCSKM